jgi:pimeloyl-ACP methyl ester carboxylesterase
LTIPAVVEHLEGVVGELDRAPIIMGHSAGGLFTQILLDHGYGAAGVAIDSAPAEGVRVTPVSQIRSLFPVLKNPANRHRAVGFTPEQFHYAFANTLSREESDKVYQRYHIPAPGSFVWAGPLANFTPVTRMFTSTSRTKTGHRCCSSRVVMTTSCLQRSTNRTPSTTDRPTRSLTIRSSLDARTTQWGRTDGRR